MSSNNLNMIRNALDIYTEQMKISLKDNPFAEEIKHCDSPGAILQLLEKNRDGFKEYRDKKRKFIDCLNPVVQFVHAVSGILSEVSALVRSDRYDLTVCLYSSLPDSVPTCKPHLCRN